MQSFYKDLSWGGLAATPAFNALPAEEQYRLSLISQVERTNTSNYNPNNDTNYSPI